MCKYLTVQQEMAISKNSGGQSLTICWKVSTSRPKFCTKTQRESFREVSTHAPGSFLVQRFVFAFYDSAIRVRNAFFKSLLV